MGTDRREAGLLVVALVAVGVGGALFPAAGLGSVPGGGPTGSDSAAGPSDATTPTAGPPTVGGSPTDAPSDTATPESTGSTTTSPTDRSAPTRTTPPDDVDDATVTWVPGLFGGLVVVVTVLLLARGRSDEPADRPPENHPPDDWPDGPVLAGVDLGELPLLGLLVRVPQLTMVALVGFSTATASLVTSLWRVTSDVLDGFDLVLRGSLSASGALFTGFGTALSGLGSLSVPSLSGVFAGLRSWGDSETAETPGEDARDTADVDPAADGPSDPNPSSVVDAWERFAERVPVGDPESATPGEYARRAVDSGAPEDPVWRLTRLFRAVRYGGAAQTDDRTSVAVAAVRAIDERGDEE
ncbi:hypothetical protein BRC64_01375 [Halobacteriales archaeon QH_10_67_22]|nr:MAG: hypothetical protein BRC64_01375 [Halobacteriales archaeon QH_10_67_22]